MATDPITGMQVIPQDSPTAAASNPAAALPAWLTNLQDELATLRAQRDAAIKASQETNPATGRPTADALQAQDEIKSLNTQIATMSSDVAKYSAEYTKSSQAPATISVPDPNNPGRMIDVTPAEAQAINTGQRNQNTADYQNQRAAIAQQTADLKQAAQDKSNQIAMMNVDNATKTRLFTEWWDENVTGPKAQLDAQATMYNTALTAGSDAMTQAQAGMANAVGPNFGADFANVLNATSAGKRATGGFSPNDFTYARPDYAGIAQKATAAALAHLSPFAAQIAGSTPPSGYQPQQPVLATAANNVVASSQQQPPAPAPVTPGFGPYRPGG